MRTTKRAVTLLLCVLLLTAAAAPALATVAEPTMSEEARRENVEALHDALITRYGPEYQWHYAVLAAYDATAFFAGLQPELRFGLPQENEMTEREALHSARTAVSEHAGLPLSALEEYTAYTAVMVPAEPFQVWMWRVTLVPEAEGDAYQVLLRTATGDTLSIEKLDLSAAE